MISLNNYRRILPRFNQLTVAVLLLVSCMFSVEANATNYYRATVTASSLNIRSGPSMNAPVVGKSYKGRKLLVIGSSGSWKKIYWGGVRWVAGRYLVRNSSASIGEALSTISRRQ